MLQYSCGHGAIPPPEKSCHLTGGAINQEVDIDFGVVSKVPISGPIGNNVYLPTPLHLLRYGNVLFYGDSLMQQMWDGRPLYVHDLDFTFQKVLKSAARH